MKKNSSFAWAASAVLLWAASAQAQNTKFYIRGGIGPAVSEGVDLEEFLDEPVGGSKIKFEPGIRFDIAGGYKFCEWFAAEIESGFIYNSVERVTGTSDDELSVSQTPFLANAVFQFPNRTGIVPFFGGGGGFTVSVLSADLFDLGMTTIDGTFTDATYAYQGFAGLRYHINPRMALSLSYKYFATGEPRWEPDVLVGSFSSDRIEIGPMQTHSVMLSFGYRF